MKRNIGYVLIVISVMIGVVAFFGKVNSDNIISAYANETGTCYIDGTCVHEQSNAMFIALGIIAAVIFVIGFMIAYLDKPQENKKTVRKPAKNLTPEQKKIYAILSESGPMLQGELAEKSGLNKVRMSRVLDRMEMLGVVERKRHGMSNLVVLRE